MTTCKWWLHFHALTRHTARFAGGAKQPNRLRLYVGSAAWAVLSTSGPPNMHGDRNSAVGRHWRSVRGAASQSVGMHHHLQPISNTSSMTYVLAVADEDINLQKSHGWRDENALVDDRPLQGAMPAPSGSCRTAGRRTLFRRAHTSSMIASICMFLYWVCADVDAPPASRCEASAVRRRQWLLCGCVSRFKCAAWH